MGIGTSIFLIAVGAILRYAVTVTVQGVEIDTVGLILMVVGIIGLVISLAIDVHVDRRPPAPAGRLPDATALNSGPRTTGARADRAERAAAAPPTVEPDRVMPAKGR